MKKVICSTAVALAIGTLAYAQVEDLPRCPRPFEQGTILSPDKYPAAYNAGARVEVRTCWDAFLTGTFLFWHASQDGMDIAYPTTIISVIPEVPQNSGFITQHFNYQPGFKCGLGFNFSDDKWVGLFEYTYFRMKKSNSPKEPPVDIRGGTPVWQTTNWLDNSPAAVIISTKWKLKLDILDGTLSRPYYEGRKLTVQPFVGMRTAWLRQRFNISVIEYSSYATVSHNQSNSWMIGPRAGCKGSWLLGKGFRFEGDFAGDLLYTRFNTVKHRQDSESIKFHHLFQIRPSADMELGLGWGSYFDQQNYHFDLLATYCFNVMWGQNQMRSLADDYQTHNGAEAGDLQIHGVNASVRLDF